MFRECSVLIQMGTISWSHHGELRSIMTQWHSCVLKGCSHSLYGIHAHSMGVQGLFLLTHWHSHALTSVQEVFNICVQPNHVPEGPMNMFWNLQTQRPYKLALNFCWMPFLWLCQARRHHVTLEYMIGRWSWCPPMRLATKNEKVLQKFRKLDISQELSN